MTSDGYIKPQLADYQPRKDVQQTPGSFVSAHRSLPCHPEIKAQRNRVNKHWEMIFFFFSWWMQLATIPYLCATSRVKISLLLWATRPTTGIIWGHRGEQTKRGVQRPEGPRCRWPLARNVAVCCLEVGSKSPSRWCVGSHGFMSNLGR